MTTEANPLDQVLKIELTAGEVNYVLNALGQRPFKEVANLIGKIKAQGDAQFVPPQAAADPPAAEAVN